MPSPNIYLDAGSIDNNNNMQGDIESKNVSNLAKPAKNLPTSQKKTEDTQNTKSTFFTFGEKKILKREGKQRREWR